MALSIEPQKVRGNPNAQVFLVEFSDFQCPFCRKIQPVLTELETLYPDEFKVVFKHYPLDFIHSHSRRVAEAAECAGDQNKFFEFHDLLFANVREWENPELLEKSLLSYADRLKLNQQIFQECLDSGVKKEVVQKNKLEGKALFVSGTPTLILNGNKILTKYTPEDIKKSIIEEIENKRAQ